MGSRSACSSPRALSSEQISPTRRYSDTVGVFICCLEPVGGLCYAYLVDRCAHDICSIRFCCHTSFARWPASAGHFLLRGQSCATLWSARHGMFLSGCPATRTTQLEISSCRAGVTFDTIDLRPKEALHEGIIITTPFATHTDLNAITSQQHPVVLSSILTAMIRIVQQAQLRIATG